MKINPFIVAFSMLAVALVAAAVILLMPTPQSTRASAESSQVAKPSFAAAPPNALAAGGPATAPSLPLPATREERQTPPPTTSGASIAAGDQEPTPWAEAEQDRIIGTINEAMSTYAAQSVPTIQPYLLNPKPEIRDEAIEAMKQIDAPEAAAALRNAAQQTTDKDLRASLEEAAEFVEAPSILELHGWRPER